MPRRGGNMKVKGARVIITGASQGIGRAIALEFGRRGAQLALAARSRPALEELAGLINADGGSAIVIPTDVTDADAVEQLAQETVSELGGIDILVNNAGIGITAPIGDASSADVEAVFKLNVLAAAAAIRAVVPTMRAQHDGMIINISSMAGTAGVRHTVSTPPAISPWTPLAAPVRLETRHVAARGHTRLRGR